MSQHDPCPVGLRGIAPSLNTPFTANDAIDTPALARLVEHTITSGCAGMLINAVAGETARLSPAEKQAVLDTVMDANAGRVPVIVGVSSDDAADRQALARMARDAGANWMLCQPPAGTVGDDLERLVAELCEAGPPNFMLQDLDWHGPGLPVDDILRLFDRIPNFVALKVETVPSGPKYTQVLEGTGGRMHVSGGWAVMQMMEALRRGVHAFIPSGMDPIYCRIHADFAAGNEEAARALFERLLPVVAFSNGHIDVALRFFKRLRVAEGLFATDHVRPPTPPLDPWQAHEVDRWIQRVLAIQAELASVAEG